MKYKSNYEGLLDFYQQTKLDLRLVQNTPNNDTLQDCVDFIERVLCHDSESHRMGQSWFSRMKRRSLWIWRAN